jgi:glutamate/tyrosine decarboxylase-like PLP-dependent enzyme
MADARNKLEPHEKGSRAVEAWFLGTKAENAELFERLVVEAIRDHVYWRRNYHPADPSHITEQIKASPDYREAVGALQDGLTGLLAWLKKSVPFFSMRYQGHMNWDLTLPGMLGYFAALLYNPNNVAFEGSTATTILELIVGDDLCRMLGYQIPEAGEVEGGGVRPWGHITCDGTVANIEAIWAARNLRFYPLAIQHVLATEQAFAGAAQFQIRRPDGTLTCMADLSVWELLNLDPDEVLNVPARLEKEGGIGVATFGKAVDAFSLQTVGLLKFNRLFPGALDRDPVVLVAGSKHYSHPKAAALLGLGAENLRNISLDADARMDINDLRRHLETCLAEKRPVIAVVVVIGTTEESAIDPLTQVLELKKEFAGRGLIFHVHADAAWGGYHRCLINEPFGMADPASKIPKLAPEPPIASGLSEYAQSQLEALTEADSITVDPHKSGYVPYPAGALCYRNGAMRHLVTFSAPVVFHGEAEPTVGIYGVEGSKPGAAAAAVYLSHRVIRPHREGYGLIIGEALFSCRKLYARLLCMNTDGDPFVVVPVPRQPAQRRAGGTAEIAAEKRKIRDLIDGQTANQIRGSSEAMSLLQEIGPDENILAYAFNFRTENGSVNTDLAKANALNKAIYKRLSIRPGSDIYAYDLIVSTTDFDERAYGTVFMKDFKSRLGIAADDARNGGNVTVLRSVVMDPWTTETAQGSFIDVLEKEFRKATTGAMHDIAPQRKGY